MAEHCQLGSPAVQCTTLTVMRGSGLVRVAWCILLVAAFATTAALGFGRQPHGIMDAVQAIPTHSCKFSSPRHRTGLASLAAYFASSACGIAVGTAERGGGYSLPACSGMR